MLRVYSRLCSKRSLLEVLGETTWDWGIELRLALGKAKCAPGCTISIWLLVILLQIPY